MAHGIAPITTRHLCLDTKFKPYSHITSLNAFTCDVNHFATALYNIDGQLTTLADSLQRLENAINGGYDWFQEVWLQEL